MAFQGEVLYLYLGIECNSSCRFCVVEGKKDPTLTTEQVVGKLREGSRLGMKDLVLSGGECTVRSDIVYLVDQASGMGYNSIQIQTNGRRLSQMKFARDIVEAGATEFSISVHGHTPAIHDTLTGRKGSLVQTVTGIANLYSLLGQNATIVTNTVITNDNLPYLEDIVILLISLKVNALQLAFIHAQGGAETRFDEITPTKSMARSHIIKAIKRGVLEGYGVGQMMIEAYPYCFLRGYEAFCSDIYIPPYITRNDKNELDSFPLLQSRAKGDICKLCNFNEICYGPWLEYPEKRGWGEFIPITDITPEQAIPSNYLHFSRLKNAAYIV